VAADNPYAPPKSNVDTGSRRAIETRPVQVTCALWLNWTSIALSIPTAVYEYGTLGEGPVAVPMFIVIVVLMYGIEIALAILIGQGRNWARITYLVLAALSFISIPPSLARYLQYPLPQLALNASILALYLAVIYLPLPHPGSLWLRKVERASTVG